MRHILPALFLFLLPSIVWFQHYPSSPPGAPLGTSWHFGLDIRQFHVSNAPSSIASAIYSFALWPNPPVSSGNVTQTLSDGNVNSSHRIWDTFQLEHYLADIVLDGLLITHQIFLCCHCSNPDKKSVWCSRFFSLASEFGTSFFAFGLEIFSFFCRA